MDGALAISQVHFPSNTFSQSFYKTNPHKTITMRTLPFISGLIETVAILISTAGCQKHHNHQEGKTSAQRDSPYQTAIDKAYAKFGTLKKLQKCRLYKRLANWLTRNIYGIANVAFNWRLYTKGDLDSRVSIQSISKEFALALVIEEQGAKAVMDKIGVDAPGLRFNFHCCCIELQKGKEINPLVNRGANVA